MKKIKLIPLLLATFMFIFLFSACSGNEKSLGKSMTENEVDKIQVVTAMGNPEYGAESKIITNPDEIKNFVELFNSATVLDKVADDELGIADASHYYFYSGNDIIQQFVFNGNNTDIAWFNNAYYYVDYKKSDILPFNLYDQSTAKIIIVDKNLNEMEQSEK